MLADLLKDYYNDLRDWYVVAAGYKPGDKVAKIIMTFYSQF
jgi:hypothetical protein